VHGTPCRPARKRGGVVPASPPGVGIGQVARCPPPPAPPSAPRPAAVTSWLLPRKDSKKVAKLISAVSARCGPQRSLRARCACRHQPKAAAALRAPLACARRRPRPVLRQGPSRRPRYAVAGAPARGGSFAGPALLHSAAIQPPTALPDFPACRAVRRRLPARPFPAQKPADCPNPPGPPAAPGLPPPLAGRMTTLSTMPRRRATRRASLRAPAQAVQA
jgi:hypothetical protein